MNTNIKTSKPINPIAMEELLKPLDAVREVNPPFFLRDKINAKIHRASENITPGAAVWACASLVLLCVLTFYSAGNVKSPVKSSVSFDLMPHNDIYAQP
ncbi:hypothetical protein [Flavobacterium pallidum]|uniref:Uncharacterized protein n=1 Tax=Flavobacterium pallidum TaxID=2172098 RepID=A0A2S1SEH7_9FLAO|nr:hypothetical protein [Flavobacterium pallidum]AWI24791.1 hypothetical protein HYN49_02180 [Flavobacterium pallidum]